MNDIILAIIIILYRFRFFFYTRTWHTENVSIFVAIVAPMSTGTVTYSKSGGTIKIE